MTSSIRGGTSCIPASFRTKIQTCLENEHSKKRCSCESVVKSIKNKEAGATSETAFDAGDAAALYCFVYNSDASCVEKPTYKQIIVAPSIGLVIAATMHSGFKRKRYRIDPRLDTLDSTDVVKVVIDVAYIGDVASVFHVLAHTQE
ncbi:hypothetical protein Tco_1116812 [Tanacetum coccineum]